MARKKLRRLLPYWLGGGDRHCAGCEASYVYEVEVRCVACDRPYCPVCVYVVEREHFCSECHEGGSRWRRGRSGKR